MAIQVGGGEAGAARHDERDHALAPSLVRLADHGHVGHVRVAGQRVLHFDRVDVLPAADDHVVDAAGHEQVARLVEVAHVTGEVPSAAERAGVGVRAVPVAGEGFVGVEARDDLALLARRHPLVGLHAALRARRDHPQRRVDPRPPRAAGLVGHPREDGERVDLGGAVVVDEDSGRKARAHASVSAASMGAPA